MNRTYDSVLRFVYEVQKVAGKHFGKLTLAGVIELDETYPHAGNKGVKQRKPRRGGRGYMKWMINHLWLQW